MLIIDQMLQKLERLKRRFSGRQVGVFPSDYGRFDQSIAELLEGMDVVGIYLPSNNMNDQGLPPIYDPDIFLSNIDVCFCFGTEKEDNALCAYAVKKCYPVEFVFLFDAQDPRSLLTPERPLQYLHIRINPPPAFRLPGPSDEMISPYLSPFIAAEEKSANLASRETADSPYQLALAHEGHVPFVCPDCGKKLTCCHSFAVYLGAPFIFFPFVCCQEFFLIVLHAQDKLLYFPEKEELALFLDISSPRRLSMEKTFLSAISVFRLLCFQHRKLVRRYLHTETKTCVGLTGFVKNIGHTIVNEMNALFRFYSPEGALQNFISVNNPKTDELLPLFLEDSQWKQISSLDKKRLAATVFTDILHSQSICCAPSTWRPVPPALRLLMQKKAKKRCSASVQGTMQEAQRYSPLIIFTLRKPQKRIWKKQNEAIIQIMNTLHKKYPDIGVIFDGITSGDFNPQEDVYEIKKGLHKEIGVFEALDCSLAETITWLGLASVYAGSVGAGTAFSIVADTPMVLVGIPAILFEPGKADKSALPYGLEEKKGKIVITGSDPDHGPTIKVAPNIDVTFTEKSEALFEPDREKFVDSIVSLLSERTADNGQG